MVRILGSTGSRRRRRYQLAAIFSATMLLALLAALPAQAVHDTGTFQLEGNAQFSSDPNGFGGDDWDNICASNPTTCTFASGFSASPSVTATASTHVSDTTVSATCAGGTNCTVFTGGGSKDPQEITQWKWKTDSGGLPAKDNLAHVFAARYSIPTSAECPSATSTCSLIYFGMDRIDNSGDAQNGFWFFQNPISLNTNGTFSGVHKEGDLLLVSDFSVGGSTAIINVYKWVDSGGDVSTHLLSLGGAGVIPGTSALCGASANPSPDPFCGITNPADGTDSPWVFTDKSGNSTFLHGEFYEGGINLSAFPGLAGECFSSVAAESRASTSPTATLKDFVLAPFGKCESALVTTAKGPTGDGTIGDGSVSSGTDEATLTISGAGTWTGTLDFYLCGPIAAGAVCDTGGVLVTSTTVTNATTQPIVSDTATLTSAGRYCWFGKFTSGTPNVPDATDDGSKNTPNKECFTVGPVTPTLETLASATNGGVIPTTLSDTATLTGTATRPGTDGLNSTYPSINPVTPGAAADASIHWTAFGPNDCTTVAMAETSRTVSGDGTYPTAAQAPVSFTPTAVGTYTFVASYPGDGPNTNAAVSTACPDPTGTEKVTVKDTSSVSSEQVWVPNDTAVVASGGGSTPLNGTLKISLHESIDCGGPAVSGQTYTKTLTNATTVADRTLTTTNTTYSVSVTKDVSWLVEFTSSDPNVGDSTSHCETTSLTITN